MDEKIIYWKDYLFETIINWKTVVIITAITATLVFALSAFFGGTSRKDNMGEGGESSFDEYVENQVDLLQKKTRGELTDAEALDVERVVKQYTSYLDYRNLYQEELSSFERVIDENGEEMITKVVTYRLSSKIEGIENIFINNTMDIEDYEKVAEILPLVEDSKTAYKYLYFGVIAGDSTELSNLGEKDILHPQQYLITVEMIGNTKEICEAIWEVVDVAFQKKYNSMRIIDPEIELEMMGSIFRGNLSAYYIIRKQPAFDNIQKIDTLISNLKIQAIDKFSDQQKAYYRALTDPQRELIDKGIYSINNELHSGTGDSQTKRISVKILVLGIVAGLFFSFSYLFVKYLSSDTIKTGKEMRDYYDIPLLSTLFIDARRGGGLLKGIIRKLLHVDTFASETKIALIAADICGTSAQNDGSIYIVQTCGKNEDTSTVSMIKKAILSFNPVCRVSSGMPLQKSEEIQTFLGHKNVLILVHNRYTILTDVEMLLSLCKRHDIKVAGAVAIMDI